MANTRRRRGTAREAILLAALRVIAQDGVDGVTHRRVAELARVSPGSTTHHFSSREDLLRSAFFHYHQLGDQFLYEIAATVRVSTDDPAERVAGFLCEIARREFSEASMLRVEYEIILAAAGDPELAAHIRDWEARWVGYLAGELEEAHVMRPVEAARTLTNLLRGFELERLVNPELHPDDLRRRIARVISLPSPPTPRSPAGPGHSHVPDDEERSS